MSFISKIITKNIPIWDQCAAPPLLKGPRTKVLLMKKFKAYIIQDSIYLKNYARVSKAKAYVTTVIAHFLSIGKGNGPTLYFYRLYQHGLQGMEEG